MGSGERKGTRQSTLRNGPGMDGRRRQKGRQASLITPSPPSPPSLAPLPSPSLPSAESFTSLAPLCPCPPSRSPARPHPVQWSRCMCTLSRAALRGISSSAFACMYVCNVSGEDEGGSPGTCFGVRMGRISSISRKRAKETRAFAVNWQRLSACLSLRGIFAGSWPTFGVPFIPMPQNYLPPPLHGNSLPLLWILARYYPSFACHRFKKVMVCFCWA